MTLKKRLDPPAMRRIIAILFVLGFLCRLALSFTYKEYESPIEFEQRTIALSLVNGQGYANTYAIATGPTAHSPPLYTLLLAGVFYTFGTGAEGHFARHVLNAIPASLAFALLPVVATALSLPIQTGVIAGLVGNLAPIHFHIELNAGEPAFSALLLICLFLVTARLWQNERFTVGTGALHGSVWGVALLLNPAVLPVCLVWMIYAFARFRSHVFSYVLALTATAFLVLLPWAIRNTYVFGSSVFLRSNFGLELQIGNNELARPMSTQINAPGGAFARYHPTSNTEEAQEVLRLGEVEYNRRKLWQALNWIGDNPLAFVRLTVARALAFWFPRTERRVQSLIIWIITAVAFIGLLVAPLRAGIASVWLSYPAIYYILQIDNRYRYIILWSLLLFAVFAVQRASAVIVHRNRLAIS
jgi:hypothetical protein